MFLTLVVSVALCGAPKVDQRLVGTWLAGNEPFITFAANGTGTMDEGQVKWSSDGSRLTITDDEGSTDQATYVVEGEVMTLTLGGMPVQLRRAGAGAAVKKQSALSAKAAKANRAASEEEADQEAMATAQAWLAQQPQGQARQPTAPGVPQAKGAGADQLSSLLLSSAWCSFTYSQVTGASSQSRVQYFRNGTWSRGGQSETYNSGANGTVAGQSNSNNGGLWEVRNGQLLMSEGNGPLELIHPFSVTRNSSGFPIINALGREYSSCR